ncbi:MAG TPA: cellulase family glycosylhydrolase [Gemmatimonadaceae bacterium]|nr:cellulase family glycosylhydrolase [Gemmatimonadaceae bacterium]
MIGISSATDGVSLAAMSQLGMKRVRMTIIWGNYLDTRRFAEDRATPVGAGGHTLAEYFATDVATFTAAGIEPMVAIHTPPNGMTFEEGIVAMPVFMAGLAKQFPGMRWQILNEMDAGSVFTGGKEDWCLADAPVTQRERGDRYGQILGPVYDAIKAADPTATVIAAGIALEPTEFFAGFNARAPGKYDAVAVHCYGPPVTPVFKSKSIAMRAVLGSTPLWCTEFGNNQTDDTSQDNDMCNALDENDRHNRFDRAYAYTLIGDGGYGLVRADGSHRQAAARLRNRMAR